MIVPTSSLLTKETPALIDSGSSHSFVSHRILPYLKSVTILNSNVNLSIAKLNDSVEEVPTNLVQIRLRNESYDLTFEAFTVANISYVNTPPLPNYIRNNIHTNIHMNHVANLNASIDILFGIGDMYKILTGKVKRVTSTFTLLETIWGYIPTGFAKKVHNMECYTNITTETLSRQVEMTWQMENLDIILNKSDKPMTTLTRNLL